MTLKVTDNQYGRLSKQQLGFLSFHCKVSSPYQSLCRYLHNNLWIWLKSE